MRKWSTSTWNVTSYMVSGTTSSNQTQKQVDTFIYSQCLSPQEHQASERIFQKLPAPPARVFLYSAHALRPESCR